MSSLVESMRNTPPGYFTSRWGLPEYTDWMDESLSWKDSCYIGDWSFLWERRFRGPDTLNLFSDFSVNTYATFEVGRSKHVIHTDRAGKIIHEGILTRLDAEEYMLFGRGAFWMDYNLRRGRYDVETQADDWFNFQVSGPKALAVLEKACGEPLRDVKFMRNRAMTIKGLAVNGLRQGMAGEIGFELQGPRANAQEIYDAILEAGQEFGIRRLGGRTAFINHLEACYPTIVTDYLPAIFTDDMKDYLAEFRAGLPSFASTFNIAGSFQADDVSAWYRSPFELGWGKNVKFDHDFLGRQALEAEAEHPSRMIRTLVWNGEDVADVYASLFRKNEAPYTFMDMPRDQRGFMWADRVLRGDREIGVSTSRGYSHFFREMLSLAVIEAECADIGTEVTVIWGNPGGPQKTIRATVAPAPYKQDDRRRDLSTT